jgi:hypothetical protein
MKIFQSRPIVSRKNLVDSEEAKNMLYYDLEMLRTMRQKRDFLSRTWILLVKEEIKKN